MLLNEEKLNSIKLLSAKLHKFNARNEEVISFKKLWYVIKIYDLVNDDKNYLYK